MKQGRMLLPLLLVAALAAPALVAAPAYAARTPAATAASPKKAASLRQFSGVVTAFDKSSLTVEKSGKKAASMVFARHAEMKTTGTIEKDARVTVWYREEDGHAVAHRVVVKPASK